jgi:hypothetical protein
MMTDVGSSGKVVIQSMVFWVKKVKPAPTIINLINQQLSTQTAKYLSPETSGSQDLQHPQRHSD